MTAPAAISGLFELARGHFSDFLREFESYGIPADPRMELREGRGMLCYYDLREGHIYLSLPDPADPAGKLHLLLLRSLLQFENNEDLLRFFRIFLPHIIAHELGHHYRHRFGLFGSNLWHEEQVANQLAMAVTKHRLTPQEKEFARQALPRAMEGLAERVATKTVAADSYHSFLHALNATGEIGDAACESIELMERLFAVQPEDILKGSGRLSDELVHRLEQRQEVIEAINEEYASDFSRYVYYHLGWLHLALTSRETCYVEEFIRLHLERRVELLPAISPAADPEEEGIRACYQASQDTRRLSVAGSRHFYKRYRSLLLAKLQFAGLGLRGRTGQGRKEEVLLFEHWSEGDPDALAYLAPLAPPGLRGLFPQRIAEGLDPRGALDRHLPSETDRRLWRQITRGGEDEGAANTLQRLALLDRTDIYRPLPAEVLIELTHGLCRVKLQPEETIIWEGEVHDDVYLLVNGRLNVYVTDDGRPKQVGAIQPGEVFGEMAFFTREPRQATVRAVEPSECFVIKESHLRLLAYQHPSILLQMGGVLAQRLAALNKRLGPQPTSTPSHMA